MRQPWQSTTSGLSLKVVIEGHITCNTCLHLSTCMLDSPLMLQVNLSFVYTLHSDCNKFITSFENKDIQ